MEYDLTLKIVVTCTIAINMWFLVINPYCVLPAPTLSNAYVNSIGQKYGDSSTYTCNDGYQFSSTPMVTCTIGTTLQGLWSGPFQSCTCMQLYIFIMGFSQDFFAEQDCSEAKQSLSSEDKAAHFFMCVRLASQPYNI